MIGAASMLLEVEQKNEQVHFFLFFIMMAHTWNNRSKILHIFTASSQNP